MVYCVRKKLKTCKESIVYFKEDSDLDVKDADPYLVKFCNMSHLFTDKKIICITDDCKLAKELKELKFVQVKTSKEIKL